MSSEYEMIGGENSNQPHRRQNYAARQQRWQPVRPPIISPTVGPAVHPPTLMIVTAPYNSEPGQNMIITTPCGNMYTVVIPPGAFPGSNFQVSICLPETGPSYKNSVWVKRACKVQEVLFENSEKIPEGLYKELMDALVIN